MKKVIFCKGNEGRTEFSKAWVKEAHDRVRISIEEINLMLNPDFPRDSFGIAMAAAVNMLINSLTKGMDVIIDYDCTIPRSRSRMESMCRRDGATILYKEFNQSECTQRDGCSSDRSNDDLETQQSSP